MIKIAINGFGRIGRSVFRALYERNLRDSMQIVAVNDGVNDVEQLAHLLKFDSIHGRFANAVKVDGNTFKVQRNLSNENEFDEVRILSSRDIAELDWGDLGIDVVMECTGFFTGKTEAGKHLLQGAKKVLISAPSKDADVKTIVYGVNHGEILASDEILSVGSCTTNCLAPILSILDDELGVEKGFMTTIHSYTGDQNHTDAAHGKGLRRARACAVSAVPTSTGAAEAIFRILPNLKGKIAGTAVRIPTPNVSSVDLSVLVSRDKVSKDEVNKMLLDASRGALPSASVPSESGTGKQTRALNGVMEYETRPLVSVDFNHSPYSCVVDSLETDVVKDNFVRVFAWYDNEWGFSNRMLDIASLLFSVK